MRVRILVGGVGLCLIVAAAVILHPWLDGLFTMKCQIMEQNGRQPSCARGPTLVFHHVPVALAVGGAGLVMLLVAVVVHRRRE